ncbi:hypothetical protein BACPEC_00873 [[Bacteroides] pectinophilus ATCC 43243]|uniref:YdbS-like PH domain-containing protein n=1 Tax=[Bacteroides] pectinophilus ATCC 43243 TaxID=483218 RepID=B7AQB7_9FIRM|nr:hypothetical protein BACPEC_00873 [[Bacteroides] pectinophilus ATCC 43243]
MVISMKNTTEPIWHDRKRITFFGLPFTFTSYSATNEVLYIKQGFFSTTEDEVRLYRIMDISLKRNLFQKMFGIGTIHCCSGDKTLGDFDIVNIKKPREVKALLSDLIETQRESKRVVSRENIVDNTGHHDDGPALTPDDFDDDDRPFGGDEDFH